MLKWCLCVVGAENKFVYAVDIEYLCASRRRIPITCCSMFTDTYIYIYIYIYISKIFQLKYKNWAYFKICKAYYYNAGIVGMYVHKISE